VGSEGGFADEEFSLARTQYGFSGITLGKRILRAETAAITLTSVVMFALGELQ
jgi:16S rRNA (uracil1498-N3)-methyltransferase